MKRCSALLSMLFAIMAFPSLADDRAYTEGPVMQVAAIKIQFGHFDEYMAYLQSTWKKEQEALKTAGIILDYGVYATSARSPDEADLYLTTTYANWAALDGLDERSASVTAKALGTNREQDNKGSMARNAYRTVLGVETIQQLNIK